MSKLMCGKKKLDIIVYTCSCQRQAISLLIKKKENIGKISVSENLCSLKVFRQKKIIKKYFENLKAFVVFNVFNAFAAFIIFNTFKCEAFNALDAFIAFTYLAHADVALKPFDVFNAFYALNAFNAF